MSSSKIARKAMKIIQGCSSCDGNVQLHNSLSYAELNVDKCVVMLNALYQVSINSDDVRNSGTIAEFLSYWDPDIARHAPKVKKKRKKKETVSNEIVPAAENEGSYSDTKIHLKWHEKLGLCLGAVYACLLFLNKCTPFHNDTTQDYEGGLFSIIQYFNNFVTIIDPSNWLIGIPSFFLGTSTVLCLLFIIVFGAILISAVHTCWFVKEYNKYFHQPVIAFIILYLVIADGYYGPVAYNYAWTAAVPFTYFALLFFCVMFVRFGFKFIIPHNRILKIAVQLSPLVILLAVYHLLSYCR